MSFNPYADNQIHRNKCFETSFLYVLQNVEYNFAVNTMFIEKNP